MVREITTWEASDGSKHDTRQAALRQELISLLSRAADNEAIATKIVNSLTRGTADEIAATLHQYGETIVADA